jgi:hypothetical protein
MAPAVHELSGATVNGLALLRRAGRVLLAAAVLGGLGATTIALPAAAAETHSLTVSVSNVTGTPLAGMAIYAIPVADGRVIQGDSKADGTNLKATAVKGKPGVYTFAALGDFDHTLYFATATKTTFAQLLGGASEIGRAQVIPSGQAKLTVSLASNALISGVVKTPSGKVMPKAIVTSYATDGNEWYEYSTVKADSKGAYVLRDVDPGSYRLKFTSPKLDYSPVYSGGASSFGDASAIVAGVGTTQTVNVKFPTGSGSITGTAKMILSDYYGTYGLEGGYAIAYPVTEVDNYPYQSLRTVDTDSGVMSARTGKSGKWTIKNLRPGTYIVKILPGYYNESSLFVGGGTSSSATVHTVKAGKTTKAAKTTSILTKNGGSVVVTVKSASGSLVANASVLLQSDAEPDYYYRGTTNSKGVVKFGRSGARHVIQPGYFTLTVTTGGLFRPTTESVSVHSSVNDETVYLYGPVGLPGFTVAPSIAQADLTVGTTYTVAATAKRTAAKLTYQWLRNGRPIYGATAASYTSRSGDIGSQLTVRVVSSTFGYPDDLATAAVAGLVVSSAIVPTNSIAPSVTPAQNAWVGTTLHVLPGEWNVAGLRFDYAWFRDGIPFENEGDAYVVQLDDLGSEFTATVTASKKGHPDATATTVAGVTPVAAPATEPASGVTVSSTTKGVAKGSTLFTANPGTWTALAPAFTYSWFRGGVEVGTGATFIEKSTAAELAQVLEVRVSATAPGFDDGSATAVARASTQPLQLVHAPTVSSSGQAVAAASPVAAGDELVAATGIWHRAGEDSGDVAYSYQWLRKVGKAKAVKISGATRATYTPTTSDIGAVLSVTVSARSDRWGAATTTVAAGTGVGARDLLAVADSITVNGYGVIEYYLVAQSVAGYTEKGAAVAYQWYGCKLPACTADSPIGSFSKISKATSSQYRVPASYAEGRIYVKVTATKKGSQTATLSSAPVAIAATDHMVVASDPVISANNGTDVEDEYYGNDGSFTNYPNVERLWEVCYSDCLSSTATWQPAGGRKAGYAFKPDGSTWGTGESYLRLTNIATADGFVEARAHSAPLPIVGKSTVILTQGLQLPPITKLSTTSWAISTTQGSVPAHVETSTTWYVDGVERGTGPTFTATPDDAGKKIYAIRWFSSPGYLDWSPVTVVQAGAAFAPVARDVTVSGGQFGEPLSVSEAVPWDLPQYPGANWTVEYYWSINHLYRRGGANYLPLPGDVGGNVTQVEIRATSPLFGELVKRYTVSIPVTPGVALDPLAPVTIGGSDALLPGVTLSSSAPAYPVAAVISTYQWQSSRNGTAWVNIPGATAATFATGLEHSNAYIRLIITAKKGGHPTSTITTDPVRVLEGDVVHNLGVPVLSGDPRVGSTLTATFGAWSKGTTIRVEWLLNGRAIAGATGATYVPLATHAGDEISVRVTGSQSGRLDVAAESSAFEIEKALAPTVTSSPVITGTTTLTATPGVWTASGLTFDFEWTKDGEIVGTADSIVVAPGASKSDYRLTVRTTRYGYDTGVWSQP